MTKRTQWIFTVLCGISLLHTCFLGITLILAANSAGYHELEKKHQRDLLVGFFYRGVVCSLIYTYIIVHIWAVSKNIRWMYICIGGVQILNLIVAVIEFTSLPTAEEMEEIHDPTLNFGLVMLMFDVVFLIVKTMVVTCYIECMAWIWIRKCCPLLRTF